MKTFEFTAKKLIEISIIQNLWGSHFISTISSEKAAIKSYMTVNFRIKIWLEIVCFDLSVGFALEEKIVNKSVKFLEQILKSM